MLREIFIEREHVRPQASAINELQRNVIQTRASYVSMLRLSRAR